tara:strand:- start:874 stop:1578 length:705 start_codon:yes stop_codon:yes gene_type:complete
MNKELDIEIYLYISSDKFGIYVFDTHNLSNLYKQELIVENNGNFIDLVILDEFLNNNIFKIEKYIKKFVKNIFLVLEDKNIFNLNIGIKKKNYNSTLNKDDIINSLTEVKDLFKESYQNEKIMHMMVTKYIINEKIFKKFENNLHCDHLILEIQFRSISENTIRNLDKVLETFQIKIIRYLDGYYIRNYFNDDNLEISNMTHQILKGSNENEVILVPKNMKKMGFFEKFFQLFS